MKTIFVGPREAVDMLAGRCLYHTVLADSGLWLVVAEIPDVELRAAVLKTAGVAELPHPSSGAAPPQAAVDGLKPPQPKPGDGVALPIDIAPSSTAPAKTRDVVADAVDRLGMPALLQLLDK